MDLLLNVNVEFMLCPTAAMLDIFPLLPAWVLWPSYRSALTVVVVIVGSVLSYLYIGTAHLIMLMLPLQPNKLTSGGASIEGKKRK